MLADLAAGPPRLVTDDSKALRLSGGDELRYRGVCVMIDVFVDFAVNTVHYVPDCVVIYQGLNDLPLHLMDDYAFDYSHGRRNLGEVMHVIKRGYWLPKLPWWHSYEFAKDRLVGTGNVRNEVIERIETRKPDYSRAYRPLIAEEGGAAASPYSLPRPRHKSDPRLLRIP